MAAKINPDLQRERNNATFKPAELTYMLDGGEWMTKRRREVEQMAVDDPVFFDGKTSYHFLSREQKYDWGVKKAVHYIKKVKELNLAGAADAYWYRNYAFPNENPPIGLHSSMFLPTLENQLSDEQKAKWLQSAKDHEILGTYAQTEMGHGTFIRGVETTATYDRRTEEFIINSPTLSSYKWWPGGLGKTSNYVVLMAQLIIEDKNLGLHAFLVQIRHMDTHEPMPGVKLGDIGPKFGYDMIDNGFLGFENYRIPRENMMMKNSQVQKDGTYVKAENQRLSYGTMVFIRAMIVFGVAAPGLAQAVCIATRYSAVRRQSELRPGDGTYMKAENQRLSYGTMVFIRAMIVFDVAARGLAQSVCIATRYASVRRQSELRPGAPEPQIMDYQTQQYKLLPMLASAYAFWFAGKEMRDIYFQINYEIQQGNTELLPELHALSSGLKAFTSTVANFGIEQCRLSCGGHGYSQASGIPKIYVTTTPAATYEGENTVLLLQTARYLVKAYQLASTGKKLTGSCSYLTDTLSPKCRVGAELSLPTLLEAYKTRAARQVNKAAQKQVRMIGSGKPEWEAKNLTSVDLCRASNAHCAYWIVDNFIAQIKKSDNPAITTVLTQLCQLYAAYNIVENSGEFLEDGYMSSEQLSAVNDALLGLLPVVRTNAVALVDAFDFRDEMLQSVLGRFDGNVYEELFKWAQQSPLNKTQVHESYHKYLKPLMMEKKAKL